jgi:hypothetical protein
MRLSVTDRLSILNILPKEGDITTLRILQDLISRVGFTEDEYAAWNIRSEDTQIKWDSAAAHDVEIEIGPKAFVLIAEALDNLEKTRRLRMEYLGLYEKFHKE